MARGWILVGSVVVSAIPLPCEEIVLRLIKKRGWCDPDTQLIKADGFIRDSRRDHDGLSVNIASRTDLEEWFGRWNACYGADSLHPGRVRTLSLDVVHLENNEPDHALITGLPFREDDPALAEHLAGELARMSRPVDRTKRRRRN